jgi:hypothetical protein
MRTARILARLRRADDHARQVDEAFEFEPVVPRLVDRGIARDVR